MPHCFGVRPENRATISDRDGRAAVGVGLAEGPALRVPDGVADGAVLAGAEETVGDGFDVTEPAPDEAVAGSVTSAIGACAQAPRRAREAPSAARRVHVTAGF
jgi:hypothetical protein